MSVLRATGLTKRYGETQALDGLDLVADSDQVTGVAGPNGAGKSTLMRILAGEETADDGEVVIDGMSWAGLDPRSLVAVVHQEPKLFPNLTVAENLVVGTRPGGFQRPRPTPQDYAILSDLGIGHYADMYLENCSLVTWQLTEIACAIRRDAKVFLFDEPNSALTDEESEALFKHILELRAQGRIVLLVSHRLPELADLCDRVIIVREGRAATTIHGSALSEDAIAAQLVVGHEADAAGKAPTGGGVEEPWESPRTGEQSEPLLRLRNWSHQGGAFRGVDLEVRRGQILAIMGVEGSGGREMIRSLAGLEPSSGDWQLTPGRSGADLDVSYLPADRRTSLFPNFSVGANLTSRLGRRIASRWGRLQKRRQAQVAGGLMSVYQIKAGSTEQPIDSLSGGNQQKVAVAASAATRPQVLLVEEPTRGVDIATKSEIYRLLWAFAAEGNAVIAFCTEAPEVFDLAEQVRISHMGRLGHPFDVDSFPTVKELAEALARTTRQQEGAS